MIKKCMEVYKYHSNITQKRHGASRNYRYVLDVSAVPSPSPSFGASTIYMSYDEVAVQRPTGAGSCSSPPSSSIPSKSSEPKSSMSVKSSTVAIKWVVGGF